MVLFNLGGPDRPEAVEPFLKNLFSDPAILRVPSFLRGWLAGFIARRRAPVAQEIYAELGGGSPILPETEAQARALEAALAARGLAVRAFIAMRYWHPRAEETVRQLATYAPDTIVLIPLYPQFSTTTTQSSLDEFSRELRKAGVGGRVTGPCCFPVETGFVEAYAELVAQGIAQAQDIGTPRVLFSAHGLPERIIKAGDPYAWQVERTAEAIAARVGRDRGEICEWRVTYQSRVGPLKWIGPPTDEEVRACGAEGRVPVVCPLAFVSEHSETLVELDIEYRELALAAGAPGYVRIPAVGVAPRFVEGLASLVVDALSANGDDRYTNPRRCPPGFGACPRRAA